MACFRIYGHRLCATGLRLSPGTNSHATCVGTKLYKQTGGGKGGVKERFIAATKECKGK